MLGWIARAPRRAKPAATPARRDAVRPPNHTGVAQEIAAPAPRRRVAASSGSAPVDAAVAAAEPIKHRDIVQPNSRSSDRRNALARST